MNIPKWHIPTTFGDIELSSAGPEATRLRAFELTPDEERAMTLLRKRALDTRLGRKPWATAEAFIAVSSATYRTVGGVTLDLAAPMEQVAKLLAKALKPERQLVTGVRFANGRLEELHGDGAKALAKPEDAKPVVAATIAAPRIGCPTPIWEQADVRASRVLEAFLDPGQLEDYRRGGTFVAVGRDTGHRYLITHREQPSRMRHVSYRSLFDLDEDRPLCVHDWDVPAAEEMLALLFCLHIPGRESLVREMVDDPVHVAYA